jgi:hypothetical protein
VGVVEDKMFREFREGVWYGWAYCLLPIYVLPNCKKDTELLRDFFCLEISKEIFFVWKFSVMKCMRRTTKK